MQYSIVSLGQVKIDNELFRFDAEYFRKELLDLEGKIKNNQWEYLEEVCDSIINFGAYSLCNQIEFINNGVPYLNVRDIGEGIIYHDKSPKIDNRLSKLVLWKSLVKEGQVLLTIAGTIGNAAIATNLPENCNSNQAIANINVSKQISPYYLTIFLNCKYGKGQTKRLTISSVQPNLLLTQVKKIKTYMPSFHFQGIISEHYKAALNVFAKSENLYNQAQTLLLTELGLTDWQPSHQLTFVKNYSDTKQSNRIDAEYYQPKYEEIEKVIKNYSGGCSFIKDEFKQNKSVFKINVEKKYQYVEIGSVNVSNGEITPCEVVGAELPANAKRALNEGDIIVSKVRTYRGAIAIVRKNGYVGSGAFTVLSEDGRMNKETLLTFLHSKPLLAWSLKPNTGTSYPVIIDDDILSLPIPLLSKETQTQIQQKVIESFDLRKQSRHLLECAKRAVEFAIEDDEQTAINWLETETKEIQM